MSVTTVLVHQHVVPYKYPKTENMVVQCTCGKKFVGRNHCIECENLVWKPLRFFHFAAQRDLRKYGRKSA